MTKCPECRDRKPASNCIGLAMTDDDEFVDCETTNHTDGRER